jgi:hypothetical protein
MSFSPSSGGNDLVSWYYKINAKNKSQLSLSDLQDGICLSVPAGSTTDIDSIVAKIWSGMYLRRSH